MTSKGVSNESTDLRKNSIIPGNFCLYVIIISNSIDIYSRSYSKIQTLLAFMGGSINSVLFIAGLISEFISKKAYYAYLNNCLLKTRKNEELNTLNNTNLNNTQSVLDKKIHFLK